MCLGKENIAPPSPMKCIAEAMDGVQQMSPTRRSYQYQICKPKLSRRVTCGVRINLNKYWAKFGEIMNPRSSVLERLVSERVRKRKEEVMEQADDVTSCTRPWSSPLKKKRRFQLLETEGLSEIDENLVNEIREICSTSANTRFSVCKCI